MRKNSETAKARTRTRRDQRRAKSAIRFLILMDDRQPFGGRV